jgi:uncharacterized membrane protein
MPILRDFVEFVGLAIDFTGVMAIALALLYAIYTFARSNSNKSERVRQLRQNLGTGILIGLELLIAADIVRTVAVTPTLQSLAVLGLIVLIRTFLSMTLQVELDGRWPWRRKSQDQSQA